MKRHPHHEAPNTDEEVQKEEIRILRRKLQELEEENKISTDKMSERILMLEKTVKDLTTTVEDLTNIEMIKQSMI